METWAGLSVMMYMGGMGGNGMEVDIVLFVWDGIMGRDGMFRMHWAAYGVGQSHRYRIYSGMEDRMERFGLGPSH